MGARRRLDFPCLSPEWASKIALTVPPVPSITGLGWVELAMPEEEELWFSLDTAFPLSFTMVLLPAKIL